MGKMREIIGRMLLDGIAAICYLLTFHPASFKAVLRAHRDYRKLRKERGVETVTFGEPSTPYLGSTNATGSAVQEAKEVTGFGGLLIFKYICSIF